MESNGTKPQNAEIKRKKRKNNTKRDRKKREEKG